MNGLYIAFLMKTNRELYDSQNVKENKMSQYYVSESVMWTKIDGHQNIVNYICLALQNNHLLFVRFRRNSFVMGHNTLWNGQ